MDLPYMPDNSSGLITNYVEDKAPMAITYLTMICLATFCGTVGNILVIGAVTVNKHLKTVANIFIVNLAIADLCVSGFVDPFSIIGILRGKQWFDKRPVLCEVIASVCLTSCFCSLLSIGAISFNRYIHICHNNFYQRIYTRRNAILMALALWIICFCAELPNFLGWGDHVYDKKTLSCVWDRTADLSYTIFFVTGFVAFPVILISICYLKIYLHVRQSKRKVAAVVNVKSDRKAAKEAKESMKLARTLFIIFVVFAVCWTPYAIVVVGDFTDSWPQELHIFTILIAHTNSSLNSVLYGLTNKHFRDGYVQLLGLHKCVARLRKTQAINRVLVLLLDKPSESQQTITQTIGSISHAAENNSNINGEQSKY